MHKKQAEPKAKNRNGDWAGEGAVSKGRKKI